MHATSRRSVLTVVVGSAFLLASCDIPIDFWEDKSVTVDLEPGMMTTVSKDQDIDIDSNPAVVSKAKLIKSIQIPELWVMVSNIQPDNKATTVSGTLVITDPDTTDTTFGEIDIQYTNVPILEGGRVDLKPQQSDIDKLQALVLKTGKFHMTYSGTIDQLPAKFDLQGQIHVVATVSLGG
jgi:hypothetical protein